MRIFRDPKKAAFALGGVIAIAYPELFLLSFTKPEEYEIELFRWAVVAFFSLLPVRSWALAEGGTVAMRMRRWSLGAAATMGLYAFTTNPLFLILALSALAAGALDAWVERATLASEAFRVRLMRDIRDGSSG